MRKLKIIEHISLDGVIQVRGSGEDSDFPYAFGARPRFRFAASMHHRTYLRVNTREL